MTSQAITRPVTGPDGALGTGLHGREAECQALDQLITRVHAGKGQVLVLRGEAGIGKTALLSYLAGRAAGAGCWVVRTAGTEPERRCAFAALHRLYTEFQDQLDHLPDPQRNALATAFGQRSSGDPDRFMVGLAALNVLSEAARQRPLICLADDAQWLDPASAQALGFAARRLATAPVALVFAARQPENARNLAGLPELVIHGLAERDAQAVLDSSLIGPLAPEVRERILAEAGGRPGRLLAMAALQPPEELAGGFGLPAAIAGLDHEEVAIRRHLDALAPAARRLLLIAAAEPAGNPVLVWRAADRLGINAAVEASAAGIIELGGHVRFRHHLARSVVYWSASPAERQDIHRTLAAVIDPRAAPYHRVWHLVHASPRPDEDVAAAIEQSARDIRSRGGLAASALFHEHAVARTPETARRAQRALVAARAKHLAGAPDSALRLLAIAQAGPLDELGLSQADLLRAQLTARGNIGNGASRRLWQAASRLDTLDPDLALEGYGDAVHTARAAGRRAGQDGLPAIARIRPLVRTAAGREPSAGLVDGAAALLTEGLAADTSTLRRVLGAIRSQAEHTEVDSWILLLGCRVARDMWDYAAWSRLTDLLIRQARRTGELRVLPAALQNGAMARILAGDLATAATLIRQAKAITHADGASSGSYGPLALAAWSGAEGELERLIIIATPGLLARDEGRWLTASAWATAVASNAAGRHERALVAAEEAAADPLELGLAAWSMVELIEAAARAGIPARGAGTLSRLGEIAQASPTGWARGLLARSRALLSEDSAAEEHYREAIRLLDGTGLQAELARARLLYGEWLRRQLRREDAREQLRAACQLLTGMGAAGFANRAMRELAATGAIVRTLRPTGPQPQAAQGPQPLTAQEAQIARLAADGLTNQEIGARLFLSARTVEWHLRKVYAKLGADNRRGLRQALPGVSVDG